MSNINCPEDFLYEGLVTHSRTQPFNHSFKYKITYFWFDISKRTKKITFKINKFSLFSFLHKDHGPVEKKTIDLFQYFHKKLVKNKIFNISQIKILCLPRILGYVFNPISILVCYDNKLIAKAIVFEVSNTFNQRHSYLCKIKKTNVFSLKKNFYVSPFFKVEGSYKIKFSIDRDFVNLFILYKIKNQKVFEASFKGKSKKMNELNLTKLFFKNFFQNIKATGGIYLEALKLLFKGATYTKIPRKPKHFITKS